MRVVGRALSLAWVWLGATGNLSAQAPDAHFLNAGAMPPGAIGSQQLQRGGPLPGYFQPVEITMPAGAKIAPATDGQFEEGRAEPLLAGMLIGAVYRLRVTNIPGYEALEVYPTVEVIDRLYPPIGMEGRFPITIELDFDELELALAGKFVTRVVYLEDPYTALPIVESPTQQEVFQVPNGGDPLAVADRMGRPMAIVRMGGRMPDAAGPDASFLFGSPPLLRFEKPFRAAAPAPPADAPRQGKAKQRTHELMTATATDSLPPAPHKRSRLNLQNAFWPRGISR